MNPNKALWEKGDFTCVAQSMRRSGELVVNGLGITKGLKILDLGCGDGTTALPEVDQISGFGVPVTIGRPGAAVPALDSAVKQLMAAGIPLGRVAEPRDIAGPIVFLCSDLARHITGEIVNVNGGSVLVG